MKKKELTLRLKYGLEPNQVMSHFCWGYTKCLVEKLKDLVKRECSFQKNGLPTDIGMSVMQAVVDQTQGPNTFTRNKEGMESLIVHAEEYLAIFEEPCASVVSGYRIPAS